MSITLSGIWTNRVSLIPLFIRTHKQDMVCFVNDSMMGDLSSVIRIPHQNFELSWYEAYSNKSASHWYLSYWFNAAVEVVSCVTVFISIQTKSFSAWLIALEGHTLSQHRLLDLFTWKGSVNFEKYTKKCKDSQKVILVSANRSLTTASVGKANQKEVLIIL